MIQHSFMEGVRALGLKNELKFRVMMLFADLLLIGYFLFVIAIMYFIVKFLSNEK